MPAWVSALGWLLALPAVWATVVGAGAWAPLWPAVAAVPLGIAADRALIRYDKQQRRWWLFIAADLLLILATGLLSLPPLAWPILLGCLAAIPAAAYLIDRVGAWLANRYSRTALAIVGMVPLLLLVILPPVRTPVTRTLSNRFVYLMPAPTVTLPAATAVPPSTQAVTSATPQLIASPRPTAISSPTVTATPEEVENRRPAETAVPASPLDATVTQWTPFLEWRLPNDSYAGNPFDLMAAATFVHSDSGETRTTGLFYDGTDGWRFRFTGTRPGEWSFTTSSEDPELDGHSGRVIVTPNPGVAGFVTHFDNKWGRTGLDQAFVPQYVMIGGPQTYFHNPAEIEYNVDTFMVGHGFNGMHTPVFCRWFDITSQQCSRINVADPNPDLRTFAALESLLTAVHARGGVVHIWMWGDDSRSENPKRWGINGKADRRLQRYIAARLGPLPGWTMGYGYDLFEWVTGDELDEWHSYMQEQLGWKHYLGARGPKNEIAQLSEVMDYAAYEQHRPDYEMYVQTIEARPDRPAFSEDRFRIRDEGRTKDYTMEQTRRGLWHSTMAGGVANIWGNLLEAPEANTSATTSAPYPEADTIKTYFRFFDGKFWHDMVRCNEITNGYCLKRPTQAHYLFYAENTEMIKMDLSGMAGAKVAFAVDTRLPYAEINLGMLDPTNQTWTAPYQSDWAIAIGDY